jgi:hypothetical protein
MNSHIVRVDHLVILDMYLLRKDYKAIHQCRADNEREDMFHIRRHDLVALNKDMPDRNKTRSLSLTHYKQATSGSYSHSCP